MPEIGRGILAPAATIDPIESLGRRVNTLGWHVQFNVTADRIVAAGDLWNRVPSTIVFDHMGHMPQPMGIGHPAFAIVRRLFDLLSDWAPSEATRHRILVENPETLYGFAKCR